MVRAVEPAYGLVRNMTMGTGRWISSEDQQNRRRVAVIGATVANKLFGEIPPEGESVAINGLQFEIIGVLRTKTQISNYNRPDNECLFIPYSTGALFRNMKKPDFIVWTPANPVFRQQAVRDVRSTLARLHNFSPTDTRAVEIGVESQPAAASAAACARMACHEACSFWPRAASAVLRSFDNAFCTSSISVGMLASGLPTMERSAGLKRSTS